MMLKSWSIRSQRGMFWPRSLRSFFVYQYQYALESLECSGPKDLQRQPWPLSTLSPTLLEIKNLFSQPGVDSWSSKEEVTLSSEQNWSLEPHVEEAHPGSWPFVKAAGMTILSTFLSLTFIMTITSLDAESYQPCNDAAAGGVYQKIFAAGNVATTRGFFASVQNGRQDIVGLSPDHTWNAERPWQNLALQGIASYTYLPAHYFSGSAPQPPALCPNTTQANMQSYCASIEMKVRVQNHLLGPGMAWLIGLTISWGAARIIHDCLLLSRRAEHAAYAGFITIAAQGSAALNAAYWAFGSTSVFVSLHPTQDCACFYQMPPLQALLTLASPFLLLKSSYFDFLGWLRGIIHGDYLHFQPHRIPHHVERCSGSWVSGDLMVWKRQFGPQERMAPPVYLRLFWCFLVILVAFILVVLLLVAPLFPATLGRAEELIDKFLDSSDNQTASMTSWLYAVLSWLLYLTPWAGVVPLVLCCLLVVGNICIRLRKEVLPWKQRAARATRGVVLVSFYASVPIYLATATWSPVPNGLSNREAAVLRVEQRSIGQFVGGGCLGLAAVVYATLSNLPRILVLAGIGQIKRPRRFLEFCKKHPEVVWSFTEMRQLCEIAQTPHAFAQISFQVTICLCLGK